MLGKILNLGGIDNRPPKTSQGSNRFRVARNVYPTPDGRLIPRYDWDYITPSFSGIGEVVNLTKYDNSMLALTHGGFNEIDLYKDNVLVPRTFAIDDLPPPMYYNSQGAMSYRRNNTTYFLDSFSSNLWKYDGVEMGRACDGGGSLYSASIPGAGTKFVKIIFHSTDFDGNEIFSDADTVTMTAADTTLDITSGLSGTGFSANISAGQTISSNNGYYANAFLGTTTFDTVNEHFVVTVSARSNTTIWEDSQVGSYVFVKIESFSVGGISAYALALKVKQKATMVGAGPTHTIQLDTADAKVMGSDRVWADLDLANNTDANNILLAASITFGTRDFFSVWASLTETGVYYYYGIRPCFPTFFTAAGVGIIPDVTIPAAPSAANVATGYDTSIIILSPILNSDLYDITSTKLNPMQTNTFGGNWYQAFYCMTSYQDLLLLANDNLVWFSDTTLGGSFEQLNATNVALIGSAEYGRITSICAANDFFVVFRERKIYYVTGNLSTGNYRVQEISETNVGAWSNTASICVKNSVIFMSSKGVFQITEGGRCTMISATCPKNFSTYDSIDINEDVSFRLTGTIGSPRDEQDATDNYYTQVYEGIIAAYDEHRELLVFMKRSNSGSCFVVHTKTGECYEWEGLLTGTNLICNALAFLNAEYHVGSAYAGYHSITNPSVGNCQIAKERVTEAAMNYPASYPIKLYTTWLTGGEPSLEKCLLQLKMFGRFKPNGSTDCIHVCHYKDWDISTKITDSLYFPITTAVLNSQIQYSHKKRFNSDKVLAASVGFEVTGTNVRFELESLEVEFTPIQQGIKK